MSWITQKRRFRTFMFYLGAIIIIGLLWINRTVIWLAVIGLLNSLVKTIDTLAGK